MKNNLKTFLKLSTLFFGLCLLTFSCENETVDNEEIIENGNNPFIKKGNINEFQNINTYVSRLKNQSSQLRTESDDSSNNFTVIEDVDIYVYTDSTEITYTIPIQRENQVSYMFSNLIVKTINDNEVDTFILNYTPTQEYLDQYVNYDQTPYEGLIEYEPLSNQQSQSTRTSARSSCTYITITYCNWGGTTHLAGQNCTPSYMWSQTVSICSGGGDPWGSGSGDADYGSDGPSDDNPSGSGGSGDGGTNTAPILGTCHETNTCVDADKAIIENCIGVNRQLDLLTNIEKANLANFINTNGCSDATKGFIDLAIPALVEGGDVDFVENIIIKKSLKDNYPCATKIIRSAYSKKAPLTDLFNTIFDDSKNFHVDLLANNLNNIEVSAETSFLTANNYKVEFNSQILGVSTDFHTANTMLHEVMHTILKYYWITNGEEFGGAVQQSIDYSLEAPSYAQLAQLFSVYRTETNTAPIGSLEFDFNEHDFMSQFVENISDILYIWATTTDTNNGNSYNPLDFEDSNPNDNNDGLKEYCKMLSWSGLQTTPTFILLNQNGTIDGNLINNIIESENFSFGNAKGKRVSLMTNCN